MKKMRMRRKRTFRFAQSPGLILAVVLLALLTYLLGWSSLLSLKSIDISGTSQTELISRTITSQRPAIVIGEPLARVDVNATRRAILKNEWISSVRVGRSWLHGSLVVAIKERQPVASFAAGNGEIRYFDESGNEFHSPLTYRSVPLIAIAHDDLNSKRAISSILSALPADLLSASQSFTLRTPEDIEMAIANPDTDPKNTIKTLLIRWGSASDISLKVDVFRKLLAMKENAHSRIFDLSDPLSPITK